jgi:hypothetical protein
MHKQHQLKHKPNDRIHNTEHMHSAEPIPNGIIDIDSRPDSRFQYAPDNVVDEHDQHAGDHEADGDAVFALLPGEVAEEDEGVVEVRTD